MSMLGTSMPVFDDGRTKQAFKDSTDINKILNRAQKTGSIAHLLKYDKAVYGEFENYDLLEAYGKIERANVIFNDLPSEVRNEFQNDALKFAAFASDPENVDRLDKLIPAIAEPGAFFETAVRAPVEPVVAPVVAPVVEPVVPGDPAGGGTGGVSPPVQNK